MPWRARAETSGWVSAVRMRVVVAEGQFGDRALGGEPPPVDDHDVLDRLRGFGQQVAGHQHGAAFARQVAEQVAHPADPVRVQAVERLVHDQHSGVSQQRGGQGQPLPHPQGEAADPAAGGLGQSDHVQDLVLVGCG